jgi:hypothetical protein
LAELGARRRATRVGTALLLLPNGNKSIFERSLLPFGVNSQQQLDL